MRPNEYPPGWDENRVQRVMAHYEQQSEEEAVAADEAVFEEVSTTFMEIPKDLVPTIRAMIADFEKTKKAKSA